MKMIILFYILLLIVKTNISFDRDKYIISALLSAQAYCNKENYTTMLLPEPIRDFKTVKVLYDKTTDIQGFIGILQDTIYIVFRGSDSVLNWIDDIRILQMKYPNCNDCYIHKGFYKTALSIKNETIDTIKMFSNEYKNIIAAGHSLGAAITAIITLELNLMNIETEVYNFGQPRIGNENFAMFSTQIIKKYNRYTHNRDIVPHLPPNEFGYYHSCGEIFEDENGTLINCSQTFNIETMKSSQSNCENIKCSQQFNLKETNSKDHMKYLNIEMDCYKSLQP